MHCIDCVTSIYHFSERNMKIEQIPFNGIYSIFLLVLQLEENIEFSFLASDDFCPLLITFANRLDPDHDQQNIGPDLFKLFDILIVLVKIFFEKKIILKTVSRQQQKHEKLPSMQRFNE